MQQIRKKLLILPAMVLVLSVFAVPVYAHNGEDDAVSTTSTTDTDKSHDSTKTADDSARLKAVSERKKQTEAESQSRGQKIVEDAQKERKSNKSKDDLKKICQTRKDGIQNRTSTIVGRAQNSLKRIDDVFAKVTAYQESANLTIENYDALVATANASKIKAAASVQALATLNPQVNCDGETVAADIATFKAAVKQAREDLVAYRKDVKTLLSAVKSAKEAVSQEGGQ